MAGSETEGATDSELQEPIQGMSVGHPECELLVRYNDSYTNYHAT